MTEHADPSKANGSSRWRHMALAVAIGVSVAGFLIGVREHPTPQRLADVTSHADATSADRSVPGQPPVVVDYAEMHQVRRGPNAQWKNQFPTTSDDPTSFYGTPASTPKQREEAIAARHDRRAFSGAPPVVPHAIDERNPQACLVCHKSGLKVGTLVAPKMSHQFLTNCTQCHVESQQDFPGVLGTERLAGSSFVGLAEPGVGERAGLGAPPTIPHPMWMRSECSSCHGSLSREGIRSSHPWRTNCTQCHAPTRSFDWNPLETTPPTPSVKNEEPLDILAGSLTQ